MSGDIMYQIITRDGEILDQYLTIQEAIELENQYNAEPDLRDRGGCYSEPM